MFAGIARHYYQSMELENADGRDMYGAVARVFGRLPAMGDQRIVEGITTM